MSEQMHELAVRLEKRADEAWWLILERERAGASEAVRWFHRGRHASLGAVLHMLYSDFGVTPSEGFEPPGFEAEPSS